MSNNHDMIIAINSILNGSNFEQATPITLNPEILEQNIEPVNPKLFNKFECLILFILCVIFIIFSFIDVTPGNEVLIISIDNNSSWQKTLYVISGIASFTGILSVVLCSKEHRYTFVYGFINCVTFGIYAFAYGYAGNFQLNMFYLPLQIWGFLRWSKNTIDITNTEKNNIKVLKIYQKVIYGLLCFTFWYIFYFEIPGFTKFVTQFIIQQEYPYESNIVARILDSGIVSISIIAQYLSIKKYYESWILWTLVNIFNIIMFSGTLGVNNFISVNIIIMTSIYQLNVFYGFYLWTRKLSTQNTDIDKQDNAVNSDNIV